MDDANVDDRSDLASDQIATILAAHELWLTSEGKEGWAADLASSRLGGRDLRGARLERADLTEAELEGADLSGANLRGARLSKAELRGTSLRDSDLTDADLDGVANLLGWQLAGADLTRARLPETSCNFEGLKQADRIADNAQKLYIALLGGCAYSLLTIATTSDARLITNSATSPLPIIQTPVPIAGFFLVGPLLLVGTYFYFHLYLQRLWEALADLPAVFPDGLSVDRKVDPWLLTGLVRRHVRRLVPERPAFERLHTLVVVFSAWWAVPTTLLLFWSRYLRRHEWWGTALHVFLLAAVIAGAVLLHGVAKATLKRSGRSKALRTPRRWSVAWLLAAVPLGAISLGAIEGIAGDPVFTEPRTWVPSVMQRVFLYRVFPNLVAADVSTKPPGWTGKREQIELVTGAQLAGADLRGARAAKVFLINADLRSAWLEEADLGEARLEGADLRGAHLEGAYLAWARLDGADLRGARLNRAHLFEARLEGANLKGARLEGADLSGAFCLTREQLTFVVMDSNTQRPPSLPSRCPKGG